MNLQDQFVAEIQDCKQLINKVLYLYAEGPEDRKDLRQDILSQAWGSYPKFKGQAKFSTWLYRIAINVALTRLKKEKRNRDKLKETPPSISYSTSHAGELMKLISALLNEIEKSIVLLLVEGYDRGEIAQMIGISEGNLRIKIFRIRKKLKAHGIERFIE